MDPERWHLPGWLQIAVSPVMEYEYSLYEAALSIALQLYRNK